MSIYCLNNVRIFPKCCPNFTEIMSYIIQILSDTVKIPRYCPNIIQSIVYTLPKYCTNIIQLLFDFCPNMPEYMIIYYPDEVKKFTKYIYIILYIHIVWIMPKYLLNAVQILLNVIQILSKFCLNIIQILSKYFPNIVPILSKYYPKQCLYIVQILYKYYPNIV